MARYGRGAGELDLLGDDALAQRLIGVEAEVGARIDPQFAVGRALDDWLSRK